MLCAFHFPSQPETLGDQNQALMTSGYRLLLNRYNLLFSVFITCALISPSQDIFRFAFHYLCLPSLFQRVILASGIEKVNGISYEWVLDCTSPALRLSGLGAILVVQFLLESLTMVVAQNLSCRTNASSPPYPSLVSVSLFKPPDGSNLS